jgi:hypothetical protein
MEALAQRKLGETLEEIRGRLAQLSERGERIGEQDTKAVLIEPVLAALGWNPHDLDDVRREYRRKPQDNPVDYALLVYGKPRLFVEAKPLHSTLDRKCASQLLGYAAVVGVDWCLLTNGDECRLYNSAAAVDVDEKLFRVVRISDGNDAQHCLETLELLAKEHMDGSRLQILWNSQFVDRNVKVVVEELFSDIDPSLVRLIRRSAPSLSAGEVRESLTRATLQLQFPVVASGSVQPPPRQDKTETPAEDDRRHSPVRHSIQLSDLIGAGLITPPLRLERRYKGVDLEATIEIDGSVRLRNEVYDSLSAAGGMARVSVVGAPADRPYPATNGWTFWQHRDEDGELHALDVLRQRLLEQNEG